MTGNDFIGSDSFIHGIDAAILATKPLSCVLKRDRGHYFARHSLLTERPCLHAGGCEVGVAIEVSAGTPAVQALTLKLGAGLFFIFQCVALLLVLSRAPLLEWMHELKPWPVDSKWSDVKLQNTFDRWRQMVEERELYRSEQNMTLVRAARLMGVPSRQLSQAINSCYGASFSRHLNDLRVARAQALLKQTGMPVTEVYLEAGFTTKSHFHREFARVTGQSPSNYRRTS